MKTKLLILSILTYLCNLVHSQIAINGIIKDSTNNPVAQASITLSKTNSTVILAFAFSNKKGEYNLSFDGGFKADSFLVKANCIGYKAQSKIVQSNNAIINFNLDAGSLNLPNVTVTNKKPILKIKGDTLSYKVDSFTYKQDRVIGDVLKRIPGIDIDYNGKITYNGKSISNLYIDGDDLLNDRYNIATQSVPNNVVDKIQILENHQPIKTLQKNTLSNKVAINLSLKNEAALKLIGRADLGVGVENIFNENITLMAFKKKYKAINNIKLSNAGNNIANDVTAHNINDFLKLIESDKPHNTLGLSNAGNPDLPLHRYLFNNSALINLNNLVRLNNDVVVKANCYYLNDKVQQWYKGNFYFYLPNDTFNFKENQQTHYKTQTLHTEFNININKEKYYLNNTLIFENARMPSSSVLDKATSVLEQNLLQQNTNFSNEFNLIKTKKSKRVMEFYSYFNYFNKPEILNISPNLNPIIFNNNKSYNLLTQSYNVPTFYTNNYLTFRNSNSKVFQSYKIGITGQWQKLNSTIFASQLNNEITTLNDSFKNNISWNYYKPYLVSNFDFVSDRTKLSLTIPLQYHLINYSNLINQKQTNKSFLFFNPSAYLKYQTGLEHYINFSANIINSVSSISSVYEGFVLQNFRVLQQNNIPLLTSNGQSYLFSFNYRKAIKILFANISFSYSKINEQSISTVFFYNTFQASTNLQIPNSINNYSVNASLSKYFFNWHSTVSLKVGLKQSDWNQFNQNKLLNFRNNNVTASLNISSKIADWLNTNFSSSYNKQISINKSNSKSNQINPSTIQWQNAGEINFTLKNDWYIKLLAEQYIVKQTQNNLNNNYVFADAIITHKFNKIKLDGSIGIQNIFNTTEYTTAILNANSYSQTSYQLRPRQILLNLKFNF